MRKWLFILGAAAAGCSPAVNTADGGDASVLIDGGGDAGVLIDGGDTTDGCPTYYVNSGICPDEGLVCRYFEAICYCDSNAGMWFCCSKNAIAMCPPPSTPPPTNGSMCDEIYTDQPCRHDCVNGVATSCSCMGCRWQCTTAACSPDGGTDGG